MKYTKRRLNDATAHGYGGRVAVPEDQRLVHRVAADGLDLGPQPGPDGDRETVVAVAARCLGFGRIVVSEIEAPNILANLV